jgi:hypothetical protein
MDDYTKKEFLALSEIVRVATQCITRNELAEAGFILGCVYTTCKKHSMYEEEEKKDG